jgi:hypothetical protein
LLFYSNIRNSDNCNNAIKFVPPTKLLCTSFSNESVESTI